MKKQNLHSVAMVPIAEGQLPSIEGGASEVKVTASEICAFFNGVVDCFKEGVSAAWNAGRN